MSKKLSLIWDKRVKDFVVKYPKSCDGSLIFYHFLSKIPIFSSSKKQYPPCDWYKFTDDLEKRGYDLTTIKFSIELKNEES